MYKLNNWFIRFNNRGKINYYVEKNIYEGKDQNDNVINRGCGLETGNGLGYGIGNGAGSENGNGSGNGCRNGAGVKNGYVGGDRYHLHNGYFGS